MGTKGGGLRRNLYLDEHRKDPYPGIELGHDTRWCIRHCACEPVYMCSQMRDPLGQHDLEKASVAVLHIETSRALAKCIALYDILGRGSESMGDLDRLAVFSPPFHSVKQMS